MIQSDIPDGHKEALINLCGSYFRDLADEDYIASRLLYRSGFHEQFILMGQQAIEKYLKSILLYNGIKLVKENGRPRFGHDLEELLDEVNKIPHIKLLNKYGFSKLLFFSFNGAEDIKYRINGSSASTESFLSLDDFVYHYRGFCTTNYIPVDARSKTTGEFYTKTMHRKDTIGYPHDKFGLLGDIVKKGSKTDKYNSLIWKNKYWGKRKKYIAPLLSRYSSKNPIFWGNAEMDFISQYVYIPKDLRAAFFEEFKKMNI